MQKISIVLIFSTSLGFYNAFAEDNAFYESYLAARQQKLQTTQTKNTHQSPSSLPTSPKAIERLRAPEIPTLININTANAEQLQKLPTIGPKRAAAIIKYRETLPFKQFASIDQLLAVSGISAKSFERIQAYIVI
jgi:competence ComEA-like helix-hairpin-helix protein